MKKPFRYYKTSPEIIRLAVRMYVRILLLLRNVEDLLHERGIDISCETTRFWWNRFGPLFASKIRMKRAAAHRHQPPWRWLNNRTENSHQPFRRRERAMAKFRNVKSLQKFAALHASVHNHFNLKLRQYRAQFVL